MGKRPNKNAPYARSTIPAPAAVAKPVSSMLARFLPAAQATAQSLEQAPPVWNEQTVKDFLEKLPSDEQNRFEPFIESFVHLGTHAAQAHAAYETKAQDLQSLRLSLAQDEEALAEQRKALELERVRLEADRSLMDQTLEDHMTARSELVSAREALAVREAQVRGGLVMEREAALAVLQEQIAELEAKRDELPSLIALQRQELMARARQDAKLLTESASQEAQALLQREAELTTREVEIRRREAKLHLEEEVVKTRERGVQEQAREQAQVRVDEVESKLARATTEADRVRRVRDALQTELEGLEHLREAVGDDPQALLDERDRLRLQNRQLAGELQDLRDRASEDDSKALRGRCEVLQQRLDAQKAELSELREQSQRWELGVTERENAETVRLVLEKHKALLGRAVQELKQQVGELVEKSNESTVFPELSRMDKDLVLRVTTESAPPLSTLVDELQSRIAYAEAGKQLFFPKQVLQLFVGGLAMSQLHILQGISGTGKTSLVTAFCAAIGAHCQVVSVQAGWRDQHDLIGHYNAFEKRYYEKDTLQALYRAQTEAQKDMLHVILLDEMNLSRPEQYFAEFLSKMEVTSDKRLITLMESRPASGAPSLLRDGRQILLPDNVWFIGTANHDETTNAFADKTHDRAFVLELPKHAPGTSKLPRPKTKAIWSFSQLTEQFREARVKHAEQVRQLLQRIDGSDLTKVLNDKFNEGWGHRLEQQLLRFLPVVLECGGTPALALDHMLATRMFRDGKVTGRHNKSADDLREVQDALEQLWHEAGLGDSPASCLKALEKDIQRLERH
ncbi:AAA family ATPase [Pseudacidovorax sp. RU35E]|uniref:AAA family ATPase n=1 Tax=Pseudacidovorax sp. RU35E TaxID=1907403 RepID=UPI0009546363|nr:AAA family ATPase [Pseudacidovorax sp. RU35E]SIR51248.1 ATPase family associated with various cellular activities (AAA) [Pseudacidovorax sp. RU35E]